VAQLRVVCDNLHHERVQLLKDVLDRCLVEVTVRGVVAILRFFKESYLLLVGIVNGQVDVFEEG
jgi:hypothetical protein